MGKSAVTFVILLALGALVARDLLARKRAGSAGRRQGRLRYLWIATAFFLAAPWLVFMVTPRDFSRQDRCADDEHALEALQVLAAQGPWQHARHGRIEVLLEPLSVRYGDQVAPAELLLPVRDGVFALRWTVSEAPRPGVFIDKGEVELVSECRPVQGYQVGPGRASLSLDMGRSFSWWSPPGSSTAGSTSKIR